MGCLISCFKEDEYYDAIDLNRDLKPIVEIEDNFVHNNPKWVNNSLHLRHGGFYSSD